MPRPERGRPTFHANPHSSGFEYLPNAPELATLPAGTDLDALYVCLACGKVITIDVPAWNPRSKEATNPLHPGQTSLTTLAQPTGLDN